MNLLARTTPARRFTAAWLFVGPALLAACSNSSAPSSSSATASAASGQVTVLAAASLTEPFTTMARNFEQAHPGTTITLSFGASSALATQISQGVPADVFASAAQKNMDAVVSAGAAGTPHPFASNRMAIAIPASNPGHITALADLASPAVKVAVCQPQVPCGALAQQVFSKAGIVVKPVTEEEDVKATLAKVGLGEVDAGLVYATDIKPGDAKVSGIQIPADQNASVTYPIAALTHARNPRVAQEFIDYVSSAPGQKALTDNGFSIP